MSRFRFILASASPRRHDLLRKVGLEPEVLPSRVHEAPRPGEVPRAMVLRLAEAKAREVIGRLDPGGPPSLVLAADTEVILDGRALGKPTGPADACAMLRALRAREHEVLTGAFVIRSDDGRHVARAVSTRVRFRDYDDETIRTYVAGGEPLGKAGAYAIQGAGAALVASVDGSRTNVIGLPVEDLPRWLERIGVRAEDLGAPGGV